jgi:hypothetical protein
MKRPLVKAVQRINHFDMKLRLLTFVLFLLTTIDAVAQCPMCRMSAEANLKDGGKTALGLNAGILYMLAMPYLLVGAIGLWWYKNRHKPQASEQTN